MVMHVALEYAVPHLGLTSQLMFGGLGKVRAPWRIGSLQLGVACSWLLAASPGVCAGRVPPWIPGSSSCNQQPAFPSGPQVVETFINHTQQPMLVCAPMYAPYYLPGGEIKPALAKKLGAGGKRVEERLKRSEDKSEEED